jgi:hypothetical protein
VTGSRTPDDDPREELARAVMLAFAAVRSWPSSLARAVSRITYRGEVLYEKG